jgi:hypothetical protein
MGISYPQRLGIINHGYPRSRRNGDKLSPLFVDSMNNLFSSILDSVGRFIVSGRAGTFTHFDRVVHISCRFIHLVQLFSITVQVTIRACSLSDSSPKEWVSLLRRRGDLDSHSHLSILSSRLLLVVDIVESVEKLSTNFVDNSDIVIGVVDMWKSYPHLWWITHISPLD